MCNSSKPKLNSHTTPLVRLADAYLVKSLPYGMVRSGHRSLADRIIYRIGRRIHISSHFICVYGYRAHRNIFGERVSVFVRETSAASPILLDGNFNRLNLRILYCYSIDPTRSFKRSVFEVVNKTGYPGTTESRLAVSPCMETICFSFVAIFPRNATPEQSTIRATNPIAVLITNFEASLAFPFAEVFNSPTASPQIDVFFL